MSVETQEIIESQNERLREKQRWPEWNAKWLEDLNDTRFEKSFENVSWIEAKLDLIDSRIQDVQKEKDDKKRWYELSIVYYEIMRLSLEANKALADIRLHQIKPEISWKVKSAIQLAEKLEQKCETMKTEIKSDDSTNEYKLDQVVLDSLSKMDNSEFLKQFSREQRLDKITKPPKEAKDVKSWDDIRFTFTFENKLNENLYLKTTAWQVLPWEVRQLQDATWNTYFRSGYLWEFFDESGNRLLIHDWTIVHVKLYDENAKDKVDNKKLEWLKLDWSIVESWSDSYSLAKMANERWFDTWTILKLFWWLSGTLWTWKSSVSREAEFETFLTDIERAKGYFKDDYPEKPFVKDWELTPEFLSYYINENWWVDKEKRKELFKWMWYSEEIFEKYSREKSAAKYKWYKELTPEEKAEVEKLDKTKLESFKRESFGLQFEAGGKSAQELFTYAAMIDWLPIEWWQHKWLHYILEKESRWIVWRPNYEMERRHITWQDIKKVNTNISWENIANSIWVPSTATWLWQLTMENEKYLPNWRASIWVPLDEAIGMLRYIKDRYWDPDIAFSMYWRVWSYIHPTKWRLPKNFREWY